MWLLSGQKGLLKEANFLLNFKFFLSMTFLCSPYSASVDNTQTQNSKLPACSVLLWGHT